jgi:thiol-disulfide isomerase/thioredoxin
MHITQLLIAIVLLGSTPAIQQTTNTPKTPSEAYQQATEPLREWTKSKDQTLDTNIKANKEQERLAKQFVQLFKIEDWKGKQLFDLGQLYFVALLPEGTEQVFKSYLADAGAADVNYARRDLLWALAQQKKWDEATAIAEQLFEDPKSTWDINAYVQFLIEGLRSIDSQKAILLSEKRFPWLFQLAESQINNPGVASTILNNAAELEGMYRASGQITKAEEFNRSFRARIQVSPLASNDRIMRVVDAAIVRMSLTNSDAPPILGKLFIDTPKLTLSDLKGKVILLDFMAHWCAPCIANFPAVDSLQEKYQSKGLVSIGITQYYGFFAEQQELSEEKELAALRNLKAVSKAKLGFVIGPKSNFSAYGILGLPAYALIDRAGKVRLIKTGGDIGEGFERTLQSLLAEPASVR